MVQDFLHQQYDLAFRTWGLGWVLPALSNSLYLGVLLRAIHSHIIITIQLLLRGGQYPRFRVQRLYRNLVVQAIMIMIQG